MPDVSYEMLRKLCMSCCLNCCGQTLARSSAEILHSPICFFCFLPRTPLKIEVPTAQTGGLPSWRPDECLVPFLKTSICLWHKRSQRSFFKGFQLYKRAWHSRRLQNLRLHTVSVVRENCTPKLAMSVCAPVSRYGMARLTIFKQRTPAAPISLEAISSATQVFSHGKALQPGMALILVGVPCQQVETRPCP